MNTLEITFTGIVNRLHEKLISDVPNFNKIFVNEQGWDEETPECGKVFWEDDTTWIVYADDVDVDAIQAVVDSFSEG